MTATNQAPSFTELPPLSLYIHIPWCVRKCPYCDFNSHAADNELPEKAYIDALAKDLKSDLAFVQNRHLRSIFFGGGTPSLFSAVGIGSILEQINQHIDFSDNIEITLEANPGTFEQQKFADFRQAGVNRLSIGIQSFNDSHLQQLGRIHNSNNAKQAISMARKAGFENFNLDLMHGLPNQGLKDAMDDLQTAIDFAPTHLSWYQLTIEANTEFFKHPPTLPDDDARWEIYQQGQALLEKHGFEQYEVSAYSQAGMASQHNLNYWQFGDYLGIGAGAHGKVTQQNHASGEADIIRTRKSRSPKDYLKPQGFSRHIESIAVEDIAGEFMMNALRLNQGFSRADFNRYCGMPIDLIEAPLNQARKTGLLTYSPDGLVQPTTKGRLFLDDLVALFI